MRLNRIRCDTMQYDAIRRDRIGYHTILYHAMQKDTIPYHRIRYDAIKIHKDKTFPHRGNSHVTEARVVQLERKESDSCVSSSTQNKSKHLSYCGCHLFSSNQGQESFYSITSWLCQQEDSACNWILANQHWVDQNNVNLHSWRELPKTWLIIILTNIATNLTRGQRHQDVSRVLLLFINYLQSVVWRNGEQCVAECNF